MLAFDASYWLYLLPLPLLIRWLLPEKTAMQQRALRVPFFQSAQQCNRQYTMSSSSGWGHGLLLLMLWGLLVISAARPTWVGEPLELPVSGRDLMLAVDISESMQTEDFRLKQRKVDRLTAVKHVVREFIQRREHDRMGMVLFGSQAYLQTPLTFDRETVQQLLDEAQIGIAGPLTAIGDGIGLALKRLQAHASASRVLILLTDGANTAGSIQPLQAAELAASTGLKIYTIGVGAEQMQVASFFGRRNVNPSADLDEQTLIDIARLTNGEYFRAKDLKQLEQIYQLIDQLEPIEVDNDIVQPHKQLFYWPLTLALCLSFFYLLITRLPHSAWLTSSRAQQNQRQSTSPGA